MRILQRTLEIFPGLDKTPEVHDAVLYRDVNMPGEQMRISRQCSRDSTGHLGIGDSDCALAPRGAVHRTIAARIAEWPPTFCSTLNSRPLG